jgi:hypothetical protein
MFLEITSANCKTNELPNLKLSLGQLKVSGSQRTRQTKTIWIFSGIIIPNSFPGPSFCRPNQVKSMISSTVYAVIAPASENINYLRAF